MALILVAEDDIGTLRLTTTVLRNQGHEVISAPDGLSAWRLVEARAPELIVSDVNMPGLNGFDLLQRLREHPSRALTPVILLTSLQERTDMRQGMLLGADDYLTKPLRPKELVAAVNAQLNRQRMRSAMLDVELSDTLSRALEEQAWNLHEQYEQRLARELSEQWPQDDRTVEASSYAEATVLFADIRDYASWIEALSPSELGMVVKRFYENSGDTVYLFGATTMQFVGEGVVAVYADPEDMATVHHGLRAMKAALGLRKSGATMDAFVQERLPGRQLPPFDVGIALHSGPVAMARLDGLLGGAAQSVPVGETVTRTLAMQRLAPRLPGTILVSMPVMRGITGAVKTVGRYLLPIGAAQDMPMEVCAVQPVTR